MARKKDSDQLTPLELDLMQVLWETGPAPVQTVQEKLAAKRDLAYTTVQTMLNVLLRKKRVSRALKGRAFHYRPALSRRQASRHAVVDLLDRMFGGSAERLVLNLIEERHLTPERLAKVKRMVEQSGEPDHGKTR